MENTKRNNGFILMIVIVLIPLIGLAMAVFSANTKILTYSIRIEQLQQHAKDACRSGMAWAAVNQSKLEDEKTMVLTIDESAAPIRCSITLISKDDISKLYEITGFAADGRYHAHHKEQLLIKRN